MSTFGIFMLNKERKLRCLIVLRKSLIEKKMKDGVEKKVVETTSAPGAVGPYSQAIQVAALSLAADRIEAIVQIKKS